MTKEMDITNVWNQFRSELLNFIKTKVSDGFIAEDILQEVFVKIYKNMDQLEDQAKLRAWLYKITKNTIVDYYKKNKNPLLFVDEFDFEPNADEDVYNDNYNDEMSKCLKTFLFDLPDKYKEPLEMFDLKEMKHADISKALNLSVSGSKTRIQRAREMLRTVLSECCEVKFDVYGNVIEYKHHEKYRCGNPKCD
ncbi:MAG TPA: RNA polymerase sigma factor SigZ [Clostridiales bacterium UBA8960]|nr:RNA polymerase sigma factor SigZ [Clostridiales bacterium UBA8960]